MDGNGKKALKREIEELEQELALLQRRCRELGIPVLIVFEGWSAAGKGTMINRVIQPLDPRGFKVSCIAAPNRDEQLRPFLWRFWRRTPSAGRMAIFDRSWYRTLLDDYVGEELDEDSLNKAFDDIVAFENQLKDGGTVIFKFFLDISKDEQAERLEKLRKNPATSWRVSDDVLARHCKYGQYKKATKRLIEATDLPASPWKVVDAKHVTSANACILRSLVKVLGKRVTVQEKCMLKQDPPEKKDLPVFSTAPSLKRADLSLSLDRDEYRKLLDKRQKRIGELHDEIYRRRIPVVIVYEGWDAGGKGGNIRRLTEEMDPRGYEVIPIAAPNDVENAHHYLWRFWTEFPKAGHLTIFDRSWYGRVLVERVEGFCSEADWNRAYGEINEMEENFWNFGAVVIKFWLQIDKDEQMNRFKAREKDSAKQWKLNEEDWRNREKWDLYEEATEEMFLRTHTPYAPWTVIEGNCKRYARIKALDVVIAAIEARIAEED
ncbi:MAG: polyphosphate:AMP phosphotransferase [Opitutae bacterium]|nr:polyphosphate:AMP phosphotransferase [Opitutae bacterium]